MYLNLTDIIAIISLLLNSFLILFVAYKIQNEVSNVRFFKDYLINEIKSLKIRSCSFLDDLEKGKLTTRVIQTSFISLINEHAALHNILNKRYDLNILSEINTNLMNFQEKIEENDDYTKKFKSNRKWIVNSILKEQLYELRGEILAQSHQINYQINNHNESFFYMHCRNFLVKLLYKRSSF